MKFVLLFKGGMPKQADRQKTMQEWDTYMKMLERTKQFVSGEPLAMGGKTVNRKGTAEYVAGADDLGGFIVINAPSEREAVEIASKAPHVALGGTTIVRPVMEMKMPTKNVEMEEEMELV